jgi:phenylalanyl-tRNA synthetase alpha chain
MESAKPPIRVIAPGRVYRYEATDATHETTFHQIEGLMIDEHVSIATFKGVIQEIFSQLFGQSMEIRLRPSYFPFTEPSFEIDIKFKDKWLEVAGAGMVHRSVLKSGNITDSNMQGIAFGIGIERLVMLMTQLDDIRYIHSGDLRFVYQLGSQKIKS